MTPANEAAFKYHVIELVRSGKYSQAASYLDARIKAAALENVAKEIEGKVGR